MAQKVLRIFRQHVEFIKRQREYDLYKDRIGQLVVGTAISIDFKKNITVNLGDGQGFLPSSCLISKEHIEPMKRIRCAIETVNLLEKGHQILLSRSSSTFLAALLKRDVPEIEEGLVEIKKIVREAGSAAKVAVWSPEIHFNPIGACLGVGKSRIQNISEELQGEKIEFILWSPEKEMFAVNALGTRVDVIRVIVNPRHENMLTLVVPDDHKKRAIGSGGQNVRMASQMVGFNLNILSHTEEVNLKAKIVEENTEYFSQILDIDSMLAHVLVSSGFENVEDMMDIQENEWIHSFSLDEKVAQELIRRIGTYMNSQKKEHLNDHYQEFDDIHDFENLEDQDLQKENPSLTTQKRS
jgi:N utilization substance protein A